MKLERPAIRMLGLLGLLVTLAWYDPSGHGVLQRLLVPLLMAACAWALVQNLAAVAFGTTVLALIHSAPGASDWIAAIAYPLVALAGAATLGVIGWQRFRVRMTATHDARWSGRGQG